MMSRAFILLMTMTLATLVSADASAQPAATTAASAKAGVTALMVEVTIARYQGDKRLSSLPYTVAVTPDGDRATLRIGGSVPIPAPSPAADGKTPAAMASFSYRQIGTSIDVLAKAVEDGRYRLLITVEETSVYAPDGTAKNVSVVTGAPSFRSFQSSNAVTLRNSQNVEYTVATDRISGETARISVKLTVVN